MTDGVAFGLDQGALIVADCAVVDVIGRGQPGIIQTEHAVAAYLFALEHEAEHGRYPSLDEWRAHRDQAGQ